MFIKTQHINVMELEKFSQYLISTLNKSVFENSLSFFSKRGER